MKKRLAAATVAALVGVVGAANAADFRGSLKDAPVFVPPPTWAGFYIGGHVGGAWSEIQNNWNFYLDTWSVSNASWKNNNSGVFGGGTVGYNYQSGAFVIGFEADFGSIGLSGFSDQNGSWIKQNDSFYADVTGRLGYAFGPALIYAKGGWAYLDSPLTAGFYDYFGGNHTYNGGTRSPAGRLAAVLNTSSHRLGAPRPSISISTLASKRFPMSLMTSSISAKPPT